MCGIAGFLYLRKPDVNRSYADKAESDVYPTSAVFSRYESLLKNMMTVMYKRGLGSDASGAFVVNRVAPAATSGRTKIHVFKDRISGETLANATGSNQMIFNKMFCSTTSFAVGHVRASTSGSPSNNKNNHPLICDSMVGVHNGMISGWRGVMKKYSLTPNTECDSEAIFSILQSKIKPNNPESIKMAVIEMCENVDGWMTVLAVDSRYPTKLIMFRRGGPLCVKYNFQDKFLVFCSREDILLDSVQKTPGLFETDLNPLEFGDNSGRIIDCLKDSGFGTASAVFDVPEYNSASKKTVAV